MEMSLMLGQEIISYTVLVSKRAKHVRLMVLPGGKVRVTLPSYVGVGVAERFLKEKASWVISKIMHAKTLPIQAPAKDTNVEYMENKKRALLLVEEKVALFNARYGFKYSDIRIKNQKTLWGSCSRKGVLNFNYRIALLSPSLADYIIVHELCHLKEFNHGHGFWNLVAETIPDHKERRQLLKQTGFSFR